MATAGSASSHRLLTTRQKAIRSAAGSSAGSTSAPNATSTSGSTSTRTTARPTDGRGPRASAAEPAHDVVEDRQTPPERVDTDPLVDCVEALEKPLSRVESEWREAISRHPED